MIKIEGNKIQVRLIDLPAIMLAVALDIWYSISIYLGRNPANPMTMNISQQIHRHVTT